MILIPAVVFLKVAVFFFLLFISVLREELCSEGLWLWHWSRHAADVVICARGRSSPELVHCTRQKHCSQIMVTSVSREHIPLLAVYETFQRQMMSAWVVFTSNLLWSSNFRFLEVFQILLRVNICRVLFARASQFSEIKKHWTLHRFVHFLRRSDIPESPIYIIRYCCVNDTKLCGKGAVIIIVPKCVWWRCLREMWMRELDELMDISWIGEF